VIEVFILKLFEALHIEVLASSGFHFIFKMILGLWRMLFLMSKHPWMNFSPCRDAFAAAK